MRLKEISHPMRHWAHVGFIYFVFVCIGLSAPAQADLCWTANGVLLAILISSPKKSWKSFIASAFAASLAANLIFHPFLHSLSFSFSNMAEVLCASLPLTAEGSVRFDLSRPKQLLKFLLFAVLLAPLVSLSIAEATQLLQGTTFNKQTLWLIFSADALGIAVMTPMILAVQKEELFELFRRKKVFETILILSGITVLSAVVFGLRSVFLAYTLFPVLLFALFRLRRTGAATAVFFVSILAIYFTTRGGNFFSLEQANSFIPASLLLQAFLATTLLTIHAVSAVLSERDRLHLEIQAAYREALGSAAIDHLTGLANRGTFDKELSREWHRAIREHGSLSLLMIDIDYFKNYNDHYGHVAGDNCLRSVASLLSQSMIRSNDLLTRYGGEEFAVILPGSLPESATIIAERLRGMIATANLPHAASKIGIVTLSVGVATFEGERGGDPISLVHAADKALYRAKQSGRNQVADNAIAGQLMGDYL